MCEMLRTVSDPDHDERESRKSNDLTSSDMQKLFA